MSSETGVKVHGITIKKLAVKFVPDRKKIFLDALRSGEYKMGKSRLIQRNFEDGSLSYCCLGVCSVVAEKLDDIPFDSEHRLMDRATTIWLFGSEDAANASFLEGGLERLSDDAGDLCVTDSDILFSSIAEINDSGRFTFDQIADILDAAY